MNGEKKDEERFCDGCDYKYYKFELRERRDGKYFCIFCRAKEDK